MSNQKNTKEQSHLNGTNLSFLGSDIIEFSDHNVNLFNTNVGSGPNFQSNDNIPSVGFSTNRESSASSPVRSKRHRVQPEALKQLKILYKSTTHPSIQERKELSQRINMSERSVTVWFQNRRANQKKKKIIADERRRKRRTHSRSGNRSSDSEEFDSNDEESENDEDGNSNSLSDESEEDREKLDLFDKIPLDINMNYNFIDIGLISVGSWNRRKSGAMSPDGQRRVQQMRNLSPSSIYSILNDETDMIVLISKKNQEINYFFCVQSETGKILFRMFYPIRIVANCTLTLESDTDLTSKRETVNIGELRLDLDKPPTFAVHYSNSNNPDIQNLPDQNQWSLCGDFSDGRQVTDAYIGGSNMPHCLRGLQSSLIYMNSLILEQKAARSTLSMDISPTGENLMMSGSSMSPQTDLSNIPPAVIAAVQASFANTNNTNSTNNSGSPNNFGQTPINFDPNVLLGFNSSDMSFSNNMGTPDNMPQQNPNHTLNHPQQQQNTMSPFIPTGDHTNIPLIPQNANFGHVDSNPMILEDYFLGNEYLGDVNDTLLSSLPNGNHNNHHHHSDQNNDSHNRPDSHDHGSLF